MTSVPDFAANSNFPPQLGPHWHMLDSSFVMSFFICAKAAAWGVQPELIWIRMGHWVLSLISAIGQHFPLAQTIHDQHASNAERKLTQKLTAWQGPTGPHKSAVMSLLCVSYEFGNVCNLKALVLAAWIKVCVICCDYITSVRKLQILFIPDMLRITTSICHLWTNRLQESVWLMQN